MAKSKGVLSESKPGKPVKSAKNSSALKPATGTVAATTTTQPSSVIITKAQVNGDAQDSVDSSDYDDDQVEAMLQGTVPLNDSDDDEDKDESDASSEESDDVTEEGMARLMELLGDVDPAELGLMGSDEDEDEEDEEEDDEELIEGDSRAMEGESDSDEEEEEDEEIAYSDLEGELGSDDDVVTVKRTTVNDKDAIERVLATIKTPVEFFDTLTLSGENALELPDANNDLERELAFYKQALWAAQRAEQLFDAQGLPFHRPDDYFAEMLKTDAHMAGVRQTLLDEQAGIKASEDARKLRQQKKFGKQVQVERLKERQKEKKAIGDRLDSLKKKRKNGDAFASTEDFDIALEDAIAGGPAKKRAKVPESERGGRGGRGGRGMSRRGRDSKHGHPTQSRRPKENDMRGEGEFGGDGGRGGGRGGRGGSSRGGGRGGRGGRGGGRGGQRLGKSRRQ